MSLPRSPPARPSAPSAVELGLRPGDVLVGKFRVERVVGRGGMGVVIEATNLQLDQKVALKLLATGADDPAVVERFSHEARAAARLRSEHVARVYDVGQDARYGPFIVMEMLEGQTLAGLLSSTGRVPVHRALEYVIDACEGLAEAHARGIIHLDVKPGNLFLAQGADGKPTIKLLDFGIAAMRVKERQAHTTSSQPSAGTPAYLAPEQLRGGQALDLRADVWSLGCVLYELIVGERPFRAARFTELVTTILETEPQPFPADVEVPPPVRDAIFRCLDKDPSRRFSSTGELALTLLPFARRRAHAVVARAVGHVKSGGIDPHLEMPSSMPPPPSDGAADIGPIPPLRAPTFDSAIDGGRGATDAASSLPVTSAPASRRPSRGGVAIVVVGLLVGLGLAALGVVSMRRRSVEGDGAPPLPTSAPSVAAPSSAPAVETSSAAAVASTSQGPAVPEAPSAVPAATRITAPAGAGGRPHPRARPADSTSAPASASAVRRGGDSEIRHTR